MDVAARFPGAKAGAGLYESYYLRAASPDGPLGLWIRHTVHHPPNGETKASVWVTLFDGAPAAHKETFGAAELRAGGEQWIAVGSSAIGDGFARGRCGEFAWDLGFDLAEPELHHFPRAWMYAAPLPKTKLTSPLPATTLSGRLDAGGRSIDLGGWRGMVGHNWGSQHAERWIWLHGIGFEQDPDAWLDVAIGRVRLAPGVVSPWTAQGAIALGGERHAIGGLGRRGLKVSEQPTACAFTLPGAGVTVTGEVTSPPGATVGWAYADPGGGEHHSLHCSVARMTLSVQRGGERSALSSASSAAYELGVRERDHGIAVEPFPDG